VTRPTNIGKPPDLLEHEGSQGGRRLAFATPPDDRCHRLLVEVPKHDGEWCRESRARVPTAHRAAATDGK